MTVPIIMPLVLVHDRFVFLQMRKTACTFVTDVLQRELGPAAKRWAGKHADWTRIPPDAVGRPVLTYVRNPWDWYVSWYHFHSSFEGPAPMWERLFDGGALGFEETLRRALAVSTPWGGDFYSAVFRHLVHGKTDSDLLTIGRFESLVDDLERFLAAAAVELPDGAMARIRAGAPVNSSNHRHYRDYYDDELRDLVGYSCEWLIDRFGYRF